MTLKITALCGSVRPDNATSKALALALDELRRHPGVEVEAIDLAPLDLPLPGLPARDPEAIARLQQTIADSTAVLLASPEYHGGVSSPMKLAIDNLGFPSTLAGKPVALLGVAAGAIGAIKSLEQLRAICAHVGALVLPGSVSVAQVHRVFDEDGTCLDAEIEALIRGAARSLVEYVESAICPRLRMEAAEDAGTDSNEPAADAPTPAPSTASHASFEDARAAFERAWNQPGHTRIETAAVDVNRALRASFLDTDGLHLTAAMLWNAEALKAWDPGTYIPGVVLDGASWGRTTLADGRPWFVRSSRQVAWKEGASPGLVIEEVYLDPEERSVLFFGRAAWLGPDGQTVEADTHQPLFHVEHAVTGTEDAPLNRWRIVHLTETEDPALVERQVAQGSAGWLAGFLAAFVEHEFGRTLEPRESATPVGQR